MHSFRVFVFQLGSSNLLEQASKPSESVFVALHNKTIDSCTRTANQYINLIMKVYLFALILGLIHASQPSSQSCSIDPESPSPYTTDTEFNLPRRVHACFLK